MHKRERWKIFMLAASYFFYGYWNWRFVFLLAASTLVNQAFARSIFRSTSESTRRVLLGGAVAVNIALLGYFKYADFFLRSSRDLLDQRGAVGRQHDHRRHAPGRHLVLHVSGAQLRHRHLPSRLRARTADQLRDVPLVLPARRRRTDRPCTRVHAADRRAQGPAAHRREPRVLPHLHRPVQEGRDRELPRDRDRRCGVRVTEPAFGARNPRRDLRVRGPDLRGLQRLHGHGDRDRAAARVPVPAELRRPVHRDLAAGLLAALAHDVVAVAARLPLHTSRRQPRRQVADLPEPDDHVRARRALARRGLDLRRVGRDPRVLPQRRALAPDPPDRARPARPAGHRLAPLGRPVRDVPDRLPGLGVLPRRVLQ